jgi:hypothetical protein
MAFGTIPQYVPVLIWLFAVFIIKDISIFPLVEVHKHASLFTKLQSDIRKKSDFNFS